MSADDRARSPSQGSRPDRFGRFSSRLRPGGGSIRMALSDFMPYGAPELLEGASPRMARSTLAASGLVALLAWGVGLIVANQHPLIEIPVIPEPRFKLMPRINPLEPAPKVQSVAPAPPLRVVADPRIVQDPPAPTPFVEPTS